MLRCGMLILVALTFPLTLLADGIPVKALTELKAASVFIKVEGFRGGASGSGFILSSDGETAYVVTNEHVVVPPRTVGPATSITAVFNSGKTKDEKSHSATIVAIDAELDLAVLKIVAKEKGLPKAIARFPVDEKPKLSETATVYTLGFPLGSELSTTDGNPAVTVTKSSITSLREDDKSELTQIQVEGGSNPGNSGGPLVDDQGRLIGVVNAKIRNTNIGFAIPTNHLDRLLMGRALISSLNVTMFDDKRATVEVEVLLADPLNKIRTVQVRYAKGDQAPAATEKDRPIPLMSEAKSVELKRDGDRAKATVVLDVTNNMKYLFQVTYTNGSKSAIATQPVVKALNEINTGAFPSPGRSGMTGPPSTPLGTGSFTIDVKAPKPDAAVFAEKSRMLGQVATDVLVQADMGFAAKTPPPCLCWNPTWKSFYAIDHGAKQVRRLSFPDLKEEAVLNADQTISWIALSDEGLIVTLPDTQEAWICHHGTLKKKEIVGINKAKRVLASPNSKWAYAVEYDDGFGIGAGNISVIDLSTRKVQKSYSMAELGKAQLANPILSSDGKSIFTANPLGFFRLAVTDAEISLAEARPGMVNNQFNGPCTSLDGSLCAMSLGAGAPRMGSDPQSTLATQIFESRDFKKPLFQLQSVSNSQCVGFDQHNGLIFSHDQRHQLVVFDKRGNKLKSVELVDPNIQSINHAMPCQMLVHPDGGKLVVMLKNNALITVDLKLK